MGAQFIETSAKADTNIQECFEIIAEKIINKLIQQEEEAEKRNKEQEEN